MKIATKVYNNRDSEGDKQMKKMAKVLAIMQQKLNTTRQKI